MLAETAEMLRILASVSSGLVIATSAMHAAASAMHSNRVTVSCSVHFYLSIAPSTPTSIKCDFCSQDIKRT